MEQQDKRLETLHQQASTLYLQGEYAAALGAWRQLLQLDPRDERAREGVRLCELLVQEEGGVVPRVTVTPPAAPQEAQTATSQGLGFGIGEDLDEELDELDELLGDGASTDWMDKAAQPAMSPVEPPPVPEAPRADAGAEEFDLSVDSETPASDPSFPGMSDADFNLEGADRPASSETESEIDAAFNFETPAPPSVPQANRSGPPPRAAAKQPAAQSAEELQRRADDLMAEALEHYEAGERAEALVVLDRLAILDENNQAAKTFANHIRAELEAQSAATGHELPVQPAASAPPAAIDSPGIAEDLLADPVLEPTRQPAPAAQIEHGMVDFEGEGGASLGLDPPQPAETVVERVDEIAAVTAGEEFELIEPDSADAPEPETAEKPRLPMNKWLMIAAVVLLAMGGGYGALQFFGGSGDGEAEGTAALAAPPPILDVEAIVGASVDPAPSVPADPGPSPAAAAAVPAGDLDEILDRADAAYEGGDYAAAILAYNEALTLDPQNEVARRRLEAAGEFYREQKEQLEQRGLAMQAFKDGDYRNALRILYRITPADEAEAERFERLKFNGWYNMGLMALKSGDCRLARSNLREAQQVDPTDRDLQWALELSGSCFESRDDAFFDATRSLHPRALDD